MFRIRPDTLVSYILNLADSWIGKLLSNVLISDSSKRKILESDEEAVSIKRSTSRQVFPEDSRSSDTQETIPLRFGLSELFSMSYIANLRNRMDTSSNNQQDPSNDIKEMMAMFAQLGKAAAAAPPLNFNAAIVTLNGMV